MRNHSPGALTIDSEGYPRPVLVAGDGLDELRLRPGHHELRFTLGEGADAVAVSVVLATLRALDGGTVQLTAQAIVRPAA